MLECAHPATDFSLTDSRIHHPNATAIRPRPPKPSPHSRPAMTVRVARRRRMSIGSRTTPPPTNPPTNLPTNERTNEPPTVPVPDGCQRRHWSSPHPTAAQDVFMSSLGKGGTTWTHKVLFMLLRGINDDGTPCAEAESCLGNKGQVYPESLVLRQGTPADPENPEHMNAGEPSGHPFLQRALAPTTNHQPPTTNHQPPAAPTSCAHHRTSPTIHHPPSTTHRLPKSERGSSAPIASRTISAHRPHRASSRPTSTASTYPPSYWHPMARGSW